MCTPENDLVWDRVWENYLEQQRNVGRRAISAMFIELRFKLGLPLLK